MGLKAEQEVVSEYLDGGGGDGFQGQSSTQSKGASYKSEDIVNAGLLSSRILSSWSMQYTERCSSGPLCVKRKVLRACQVVRTRFGAWLREQ